MSAEEESNQTLYVGPEKLRALQINAHQVAGVLKSMWPEFEVESSVLLKNYRDPDVDRDDSEVSEDASVLKCETQVTQKQRLSCWYTRALADHASFLEMSGDKTTGVVYDKNERELKFQAAEMAYSKVTTFKSCGRGGFILECEIPRNTD